jgi:hypothetical protein
MSSLLNDRELNIMATEWAGNSEMEGMMGDYHYLRQTSISDAISVANMLRDLAKDAFIL